MNNPNPNPVTVTFTIRKHETGDYVVRFRLNGQIMSQWEYWTNDREDAKGTAKRTVERWEALNSL